MSELEFKIPDLGEGVDEGIVIGLLVKAGDSLKSDQAVLELETGKATLEVPSDVSGIVEKIHVSEGDTVQVGQTVLSVKGAGDATAPAATAGSSENEDQAEGATEHVAEEVAPDETATDPEEKPAGNAGGEPGEFKIPDLGEGVDEGDVINVLVSEGDNVEIDQPVLELETGKATIEVPSDVDGVIQSVLVKPGDKVTVGQAIFTVTGTGTAATGGKEETPSKPEPPPPSPKDRKPALAEPAPAPAPVDQVAMDTSRIPVRAAPSVRKFAREIGVDVSSVPPADPDGRITIDDVKRHAKARLKKAASGGGTVSLPPLPDFSTWGNVRRERMSPIRKLTAEHMSSCWSSIPHVTQHGWADITKLEKLRKQYAKKAEAAGGKLTVTAILVKIVAAAIKVFPKFGASIDMEKKEVVLKDYVHIGVAVDTPKGLMVPVIRDAEEKNIVELSVEIQQHAEKARTGKISPADLLGGTFTVSNLGGIGGSHFTPIVNHPEVAILGIGRASMQQVYRGDAFEPRIMMPLSLSYDHRLIDGAEGARFLMWVTEAISEPLLLALEG